MYIYIYIYIHIHIHVHIHTYAYVSTGTYKCLGFVNNNSFTWRVFVTIKHLHFRGPYIFLSTKHLET